MSQATCGRGRSVPRPLQSAFQYVTVSPLKVPASWQFMIILEFLILLPSCMWRRTVWYIGVLLQFKRCQINWNPNLHEITVFLLRRLTAMRFHNMRNDYLWYYHQTTFLQVPPTTFTGTLVYEQFVCTLVRIYDVRYCFPVRRENKRVKALCARRCGSAEH